MKNILVIDWETTGTVFGDLAETTRKYQGISVGAVVLNGDTLETVDQLYLVIKFDLLFLS